MKRTASLELRYDHETYRLAWHNPATGQIVDELTVPSTSCGCGIEEFRESPSGNWIVTARWSGQGEWGYDVIRSKPLERLAGISERGGYILDLPKFSADESYVLGGYGYNWLRGWWVTDDDDCYEDPSRGGIILFGWLFRHSLPSQDVTFHKLRMDLPSGWFPNDFEDEKWLGARAIAPLENGGVKMMLPGGIPFECAGPLPDTIDLPVPHPDGGMLL